MVKTLMIAGTLIGVGTVVAFSGTGGGNTVVSSFRAGRAENASINLAAPSSVVKNSNKELPAARIELSKSNSLVFRGEVDGLSVSKAQQALLNLDKKLAKGLPIYLVLDTPGGDIMAGNQLIDTAKSINRPIHTITIFAASMGFNIVQRLNNRYILPSGTLMAHRARVGGVGGQIPGEFITAAATLYNLVLRMENQNASRLGINMDSYTSLVKDEYWVDGEDSVRQNAADSLAYITCDSSLSGSSKEIMNTFFGPIELEWSNCPAVTQPLGFSMGGGGEEGAGDRVRDIKKLLTSRKQFRQLELK